MDYGKEFEKFAIKDQGISSTYYNKIISSMYPTNLTPNIIEERQMNIAIFDVFSRLMMDRIIFMGTAINDQVANKRDQGSESEELSLQLTLHPFPIWIT